MSHNEVYDQFKMFLPMYARCAETWFPNGKNSIRVRQMGGHDFIFTFKNDKDWRFETLTSFLNKSGS